MSEPKPADTLSIYAPYPEGAITAVARRASEKGLLRTMYLPSRAIARGAARLVRRFGNTGLADRLFRTPADIAQLMEIAPVLELQRLAVVLLGGRSSADAFMHRYKRQFDRRICASDLVDHAAVIGMSGACLQIFRKQQTALKVLHQVDAHPRAHNAALLSHYSELRAKNELLPAHVVVRMEEELHISDLVVVPSRLVERQMVDQGIAPRKLARVPYGVNLAEFKPIRLPILKSRPQILFVGQVSLRKGVPFLIEAMRRVDADLKIIGTVVDGRLLKNLPSNVAYAGTQSRSEVVAAMASADAFVLPSIEDACALVIAEAAASGLPVISTAMNGACEILTSTDLREIVPGSTGDLVNALASVNRLAFDAREERANRIRQRALQNSSRPIVLDWCLYADQFISAIDLARFRTKAAT